MLGSNNLERTEKAARNCYERDLRLAISCVADVSILTKWSAGLKRWLLVASLRRNKDMLASGSMSEDTEFIQLRCKGNTKLYFELDQHIEVLKISTQRGDRYRVSTLRYIYCIWSDPDTPLIAWHYHPDLDVPFPHFHVYDRLDEADKKIGLKVSTLHGLHIPSGRVSLEEVIRFAIVELGVVPHKSREHDWSEVLRQTSARFEAQKTWGQSPPI